MTKADLLKDLQEATGLNGIQTKEFFERLGDIMAAELLGGGEVPLPRIGKIVVADMAARMARNPKTGETIQVPAKKKLTLKVGREMKDALQ